MADVFTTEKRSEIMSKIRGKGNRSTELRLITLMRRARIVGWRRHYPLLGKPDFVFPQHRLAVFVDGCFWHLCPHCADAPANNAEYWRTKLEGNRTRDRKVDCALQSIGWKPIRIWEHELRDADRVLRRLDAALRRANPVRTLKKAGRP